MASTETSSHNMPTEAPLKDVQIKLHWLDQSRSQRILWLLEELHLPYELELYKREATGLAPPKLKEVHPLGKSPVLSLQAPGMSEPLTLAESGFMVEYLSEYFGKWLIPSKYPAGKEGQIGQETESWMRYRFFMHYIEGSLMTILTIALIVNNIKTKSPFFVRFITNGIVAAIYSSFLSPNFATHFGFLESQLASSPDGGEFLCGKELTGADVLMSFPLLGAQAAEILTEQQYPKLTAYIGKLEQREAYKRAVQKIVEIDGSYKPTLKR